MLPLQGHAQEPTAETLIDVEQEIEVGSPPPSRSASNSSGKTFGTLPRPMVDSPAPVSMLFPREELVDQREAHPPPVYVPPTNEHRCLILCFDGTGDQFDADNSNIVQLMSALKKDDRSKQMVYYQAGIGTYVSNKSATPLTTKISLTLDVAIAWNLDDHVMAGYEFLMQNYTPNDRICIFGFSRGAYIARSLAGMIHKVGLLPVDNHQQVPFAYRMYTRADAVGWAQSNAFKKAFSNDVHIDFIGVWDTVDSVGLIPRRLPFTTSNTIVRTFRHAVSLDERRAKFKANLWNWPSNEEKTYGLHTPPGTPALRTVPLPGKLKVHHAYTLPKMTMPNLAAHFRSSTDPDENVEQAKFENAYVNHHHRKTKRTDVVEVWFAGCHCDVGGGSVPNGTRNSLARIPLRWMIRECFKAETGIMFDAQRLFELGLDPNTLYPEVKTRPPPLHADCNARIESRPKPTPWLRRLFKRKPSADADDVPWSPVVENQPTAPWPGMEEEEDLKDALSPMYDQLKLSPFWWILEIIPFSSRTQRRDDTWETHTRWNFGRPRKIPHQRLPEKDPEHPAHYDEEHKPPVDVKVHRTVQTRRAARDARGRFYVNRAHLHCEPQWVD